MQLIDCRIIFFTQNQANAYRLLSVSCLQRSEEYLLDTCPCTKVKQQFTRELCCEVLRKYCVVCGV